MRRVTFLLGLVMERSLLLARTGLSENFSERVRLPCENTVQVCCAGATSSEAASSATDRPFGENAAGQINGLNREAFARSARTRRSVRNSRGGPRTGVV